jgi:hypothetical protein
MPIALKHHVQSTTPATSCLAYERALFVDTSESSSLPFHLLSIHGGTGSGHDPIFDLIEIEPKVTNSCPNALR